MWKGVERQNLCVCMFGFISSSASTWHPVGALTYRRSRVMFVFEVTSDPGTRFFPKSYCSVNVPAEIFVRHSSTPLQVCKM